MGRITLQHLSADLRARVCKEHGIRRENRSRTGFSLSPYADCLGSALEKRFPGRVHREYRPLEHRRYRIDFAFPEEKLAIEFDGYRHHGFSREGFRKGLERQNLLVMDGWRMLRYSLTDVRDRMDAILEEVERSLNA